MGIRPPPRLWAPLRMLAPAARRQSPARSTLPETPTSPRAVWRFEFLFAYLPPGLAPGGFSLTGQRKLTKKTTGRACGNIHEAQRVVLGCQRWWPATFAPGREAAPHAGKAANV